MKKQLIHFQFYEDFRCAAGNWFNFNLWLCVNVNKGKTVFRVHLNESEMTQMAAVGCWRLSWVRWWDSAKATNGLHQNALSSPVKERDGEVKGCLGSQGCHYIILLLFLTSGVMQLFSEGSWQPIICSAGRSNLRILTVDWEDGGGRVTDSPVQTGDGGTLGFD